MANIFGESDGPLDTRIPPTGGSGTAPPRDTVGSFVAHLRAEIDRLTTLHRAEQEHNRRLMAACSLYRSGLEISRTALHQARLKLGDDDTFGDDLDEIGDRMERGDDLAIPTAK